MVYTDGIHMVADTVEELHAFADEIGLKRSWFQDHRHQHYDLFGAMVTKAIVAGAKVVGSRSLVLLKQQKELRSKVMQPVT